MKSFRLTCRGRETLADSDSVLYCDGERVSCPGWMTQWGSKYLGDGGYSAIQKILRNFYGSNLYIDTAEEISGIPLSWPGI